MYRTMETLNLLFITWDPPTELFRVGEVAVRWYSIMWIIGLLLAYATVRRLYKQQGIADEKFDPLFVYCFIGILVGARLGHCLLYDPGYFLSHPIEMCLPIRKDALGAWHYTGYSGLASHGGTLGLMLALWFYVRRYKISILRVLDNIAIATPLTAAFIRFGNLMNSEIVGKVTNWFGGFIFVQNGDVFPRYPAQLMEGLYYLILFPIMWIIYRRGWKGVGSGFFFGFVLTMIFVFRFFIEMIKEVQEPWELSMVEKIGLDQGQLLSIPFVLIGLYFLVIYPRRKSTQSLNEKK